MQPEETTRTTHSSLPITFSGWDEAGDFGDMQFYDVEFTEDFGPFKKGEKTSCLVRMDSAGTIEGYDKNAASVKKCRIKYIAQ